MTCTKSNNKELKFNLKIDHSNGGWSKQRMHTVECNGSVIGTLYDNRLCDEKDIDFVFNCQSSRISGQFTIALTDSDHEYITYAKGVEGNDLAVVLDEIRNWGEAVSNRVASMRDEFIDALNSIPECKFGLYDSAKTHKGVTARILKGSSNSFIIDLTWNELAKMYGSSYFECDEYQVTDCGLDGKEYGVKWHYRRNDKTIYASCFSGYNLLAIERTEKHISSNN